MSKDDQSDPRFYSVEDYEKVSSGRFHKFAFGYFNSGANSEYSLEDQYKAFDRIKLRQRTFVDRAKFEGTQTTLLGHPLSSPICQLRSKAIATLKMDDASAAQ